MTIPEKLQKIIDEFNELEDTEEKYELLMEYGEKLEGVKTEDRITHNLVPGCMSVVYISAEIKDDKIIIHGEADSLLVKGLVQVLIEGLSGINVNEFLKLDDDFIIAFGLTNTLTPSRSNASKNIFLKMKEQVKKELKN
jgi:cysteine desulfuration protein SufE